MSDWMLFIGVLMASTLGGVFFAFSSFIMPALARIPTAEGVRTMQWINIKVFHWSFMGLFFATPLLCLGFIGDAILTAPSLTTPYTLAAAGVYLVGSLLVTGLGNVPLNEKLAKLDPEAADANSSWHSYRKRWVRLNHIRTGACLLTAGLFIGALLK